MSEVFITDMLAGEQALRNAAREARSRRIVRSPSARTALAVAQDLASDSLSALEWVDVCAQPWRYRQSVTVTLGYLRAGYDPQFASILGTAMVDLHLVEMHAKSRIDREAESIRAFLRAYRSGWSRHPDCIQFSVMTRFQRIRFWVFMLGVRLGLWRFNKFEPRDGDVGSLRRLVGRFRWQSLIGFRDAVEAKDGRK